MGGSMSRPFWTSVAFNDGIFFVLVFMAGDKKVTIQVAMMDVVMLNVDPGVKAR
jgi:hypothetical protein